MNVAVIFAGGSGQRMNHGGIPKQFLEFRGKPIIIYTLELFENHPEIDAITIACIEEWIPHLSSLIKQFRISKVKGVVKGGNTSQDSIRNALECTAQYAPENSVVLIHDGVRPLITPSTISENILTVKKYGTCITCVPAIETILVKTGESKLSIPKREDCRLARAPQSFFLRDILKAQRRAVEEGRRDFIDCCTLMHHYGYELHTVEGPVENIKITTPTDFYLFKAWVDIRNADLCQDPR